MEGTARFLSPEEVPGRDGWDRLTALLFLCAAALAFDLATDFGVSADEPRHWEYGEQIRAFFTSHFRDTRAAEPIFLNFYGGAYDLPATLVGHLLGLDPYRTARVLLPVLGLLGVAGCWRLARMIAGPQAGFWAALLLLTTPVYVGHMCINPKDLPFAVGYIWSLYFLARILLACPRIPPGLVVRGGVVIGLTMNVRIYGGLLLIYLILLLIWQRRHLTGAGLAPAPFWRQQLPPLLGVLALATFFTVLFWPAMLMHPFATLRAALATAANAPVLWPILFAGREYTPATLPAIYIPVYFAITAPEVLLILLPPALLWSCWRVFAGAESGSMVVRVGHGVLLLGIVCPVLPVLLLRPSTYNGIRHFLFLLPPLAVLQALFIVAVGDAWRRRSWKDAWRRRSWKVVHGLGSVVFVLALLSQVVRMAFLHPLEYSFYNVLVGGLQGAAGRFEVDYWFLGYKPIADYLGQRVKNDPDLHPRAGAGQPFRLFVSPQPELVTPFLDDGIVPTRDALEADFVLVRPGLFTTTIFDGDRKFPVARLPGRNLHRIKVTKALYNKRFGTSLSAILFVHPKEADKVCIPGADENYFERGWRKAEPECAGLDATR
ncbi:MAG: glycosyltransferase family 39 protein [Magnetococcales bacterium]|nr:glycosyltransferase family 39 protein [Magnetococcales bacterium]